MNVLGKPNGLRKRLTFQIVSALACALLGGAGLPYLLRYFYSSIGFKGTEAVYWAGHWTIVLACCLLGGILGSLLGNLLYQGQRKWLAMQVGDRVTLFLGLFVGILASLPFLILLDKTASLGYYSPLVMLAILVVFTMLSLFGLQSMGEILPWNRGNVKAARSGIKILDTNVIIDGRIYDVARAGFIEGQLYVPGFVLEELQHIADSPDVLRRQRGRRGLDVLRLMQADFPLEVRVHDRLVRASNEDVDNRLVRLARSLGADIVTNDFNLNRVAALQDVKVLNMNDLSLAVRSNVLPQETLTLPLVREGNQPGQGVGYLEDGTMVVVENGKARIGDTLEVVVTQVIQTERGKMIFAEIADEQSSLTRRPASRRLN